MLFTSTHPPPRKWTSTQPSRFSFFGPIILILSTTMTPSRAMSCSFAAYGSTRSAAWKHKPMTHVNCFRSLRNQHDSLVDHLGCDRRLRKVESREANFRDYAGARLEVCLSAGLRPGVELTQLSKTVGIDSHQNTAADVTANGADSPLFPVDILQV